MSQNEPIDLYTLYFAMIRRELDTFHSLPQLIEQERKAEAEGISFVDRIMKFGQDFVSATAYAEKMTNFWKGWDAVQEARREGDHRHTLAGNYVHSELQHWMKVAAVAMSTHSVQTDNSFVTAIQDAHLSGQGLFFRALSDAERKANTAVSDEFQRLIAQKGAQEFFHYLTDDPPEERYLPIWFAARRFFQLWRKNPMLLDTAITRIDWSGAYLWIYPPQQLGKRIHYFGEQTSGEVLHYLADNHLISSQTYPAGSGTDKRTFRWTQRGLMVLDMLKEVPDDHHFFATEDPRGQER